MNPNPTKKSDSEKPETRFEDLQKRKASFEDLLTQFDEQDKIAKIYVLDVLETKDEETHTHSKEWRKSFKAKSSEDFDIDDLRTTQNRYERSIELKELVTFGGKLVSIELQKENSVYKNKQEIFAETKDQVKKNLKVQGAIQEYLTDLILFNARMRMIGAIDFLQPRLLKRAKTNANSFMQFGKKISRVNWTVEGRLATCEINISIKTLIETVGFEVKIWGLENNKLVEFKKKGNSPLRSMPTLAQLIFLIQINNQGRMRMISFIASHANELTVSREKVIVLQSTVKKIKKHPQIFWKMIKNYPQSAIDVRSLDFYFSADLPDHFSKRIIINDKEFVCFSDISFPEIASVDLKKIISVMLSGEMQIIAAALQYFKDTVSHDKKMNFLDYSYQFKWYIENGRIYNMVDYSINILDVNGEIKSNPDAALPIFQFRNWIEIQVLEKLTIKAIKLQVESLTDNLSELFDNAFLERCAEEFVPIFDRPQNLLTNLIVPPKPIEEISTTASTDIDNFSSLSNEPKNESGKYGSMGSFSDLSGDLSASFKRGFNLSKRNKNSSIWSEPDSNKKSERDKKTSEKSEQDETMSVLFEFREQLKSP